MSPSAEALHLRSNSDKAKARAAVLRGPTSQPSITNLARPMAQRAVRLRACNNAAPLVEAYCLLAFPSRRIGETIVVSMANCAPLKRGRPSTTTSKRRLSTCLSGRRSISCTLTFTVTRPPASRQTLAAALSRANPRRPNTPRHRTSCAMVATRVKWTATSADDKGGVARGACQEAGFDGL